MFLDFISEMRNIDMNIVNASTILVSPNIGEDLFKG